MKEARQRKDKYCTVSLTCDIFKKKKEKSQTHSNREYNGGCQELRDGGNGERLVKRGTSFQL